VSVPNFISFLLPQFPLSNGMNTRLLACGAMNLSFCADCFFHAIYNLRLPNCSLLGPLMEQEEHSFNCQLFGSYCDTGWMAGGIEGLCNISCCFVWEEIKL